MHIGTLILLSQGEVEMPLHTEVFNHDDQAKNNLFATSSLKNRAMIAGADFNTENVMQTFTPFEFTVDEESKVLFGKFTDGGKATKGYLLKVILLVEEYPVLIKEENHG